MRRGGTPRRRALLLAASGLMGLVLVVGALLADGGSDDPVRIDAGVTPDDLAPTSGERPVPDVVLTDLDGSQTLRLSDLRGTPLVVNFFASWCVPCVAEMPEFEEVAGEFGDAVRFVGVNTVDDRISDARRIVEQTGVTYTIVRDTEGSLFAAVGAFAMPTTIFVTADGEVARLRGGRVPASELREIVATELLAD